MLVWLVRKAGHFERALALALLAHAGVLVASGRLGSRTSPPLPRLSSDPIEIRIETLPSAPDPGLPPPTASPTPSPREVPMRDPSLARASDAHEPTPRVPMDSQPASTPRASDVAPGASSEPWTFSPSAAGSVWLGLRASPDAPSQLGHADRGVGDGSGGDDRPVVSTEGAAESLRAALDSHDRSLGLGAGGPLVEPTRDVVSASLVPNFARAILEFTTDRAGLVVSVRVLDASSDRQAWDEVAAKLALETRKKPLRMPPGARGVAVTMQVESTVRNASGQDPSQGVLSRVAGGLFEPSELLMDSNAKPRRIVVAKVIGELRL